MNYPAHLSPDQQLQRTTYVGILSLAESVGEFSTWLLTGTAAILGAIIVNVEAVSKVLSSSSLRWGLALLVASMLAGVITKQFGMAISKGMTLVENLYAEFETPRGAEMLAKLKSTSETLNAEIAKPFSQPFKYFIRRSFIHGENDALAPEKKFIRMFCWEIYASYFQSIFGACGLLWLGLGIK